MKSSITEIGSGLFGIAIAFFYVAGCIHSSKKHKDDGDILMYTPFSVYRGIEMFWHNDYAGVDWKEKVTDDVGTAIQLMSSTMGSSKIDDVKSQINEFADKISKYPPQRKKEVKEGVVKFYRFLDSWTNDFTNYIDTFKADTHFKMGFETSTLYDSLNVFYNVPGLNIYQTLNDSMENIVKENKDNLEELKSRLHLHQRFDIDYYDKAFFKIFGEHLKTMNL